MKLTSLQSFFTFVLIVASSTTGFAQSDGRFGELLKRIPNQSNLLMLIDVDGLFNSPLGKREQWREKASSQANGGLGLPPAMSRIAVASGVDLHDFTINWRVGMAEYQGRLPDLPNLAAREGGFVEPINLAKVAWTPRDLYFVTFEPRVIGFVTPADRQSMAKWITSTFVKPRTFNPAFADRAVNRAEAGSQIVLAINLTDAVSATLIKPWLSTLDGMKSNTLDPGFLAEQLSCVQSAFLQVDVKETIEGTIRVEFERPADYAKPVGKAVVLASLAAAGADLDDLKTWTGGVDGRSIILSGRLSESSVRRILSLAHPPRLTPEHASLTTASAAAPAPAEPPPSPKTSDDVVKASQGYFRSVVDILDSLKGQKSTSYHGMKLWYERAAKQIDELPILGVDKELLDWGSTVSRTLREMAYGINYNVQDRRYSLSTANGYYDGYGVSNAPQETVRQQGEAALSVGLDGKWQVLNASIPDTPKDG